MMRASENCRAIIRHFEGFEPKPYICPTGHPTIGYGTRRYENGKPVRISDPAITRAEAEELMRNDLKQFECDVNSLLKVCVNQDQFDALVSFAYNVGSDIDSDDIAEGLGDSTLLKLINGGIIQKNTAWKREITKQFNSWKKGRVGGVKKVIPGLVKRRFTESLLFCDGKLEFLK